ncbi:MAG: hypothetical protein ACI30M_04125 [Muribaculaceae bacterium]
MGKSDNKKSLFWTSYSDLMTSLFFAMLVLFVVVVVAMGRVIQDEKRTRKATQQQIAKIQSIENSIKNIDANWFEYNNKYKKHVLKIDVSFPKGQSDITNIPIETREDLYNAGLAIDKFLKNAEKQYGDSVNYLLIIEGQASNDGYSYNFELSYARALSLYRYLETNRQLDLKRDNCEVLICGSGTQGTMRSYPDNASNEKNQRFLIHILPKPGIVNGRK